MRTHCCEAAELSHRGFSQRKNTSVQTRIKNVPSSLLIIPQRELKSLKNCCNSYMLLR